MVPGPAGRGGGSLRPPSGCPGESAKSKTELTAAYRRRAAAEASFAATVAPLKARLIADKTAWLQANIDDVRVGHEAGCSKKLWGLVRSVSGRRGRGAKVAAVMHDEEGRVLQDEQDVCRAWERCFLREFFDNGVIAEVDPVDGDRPPFDFAAPLHG